MGLINALSIASSGLRTVQSGLTSVANNVAQADVDGYKRQDLRPESLGVTSGVRGAISRASDRYLENQVRLETSRSSETAINSTFLSRVDQLFGVPGEAGSLDSLLNGFNTSLQQLSTSPDDYVSREQTLGAAEKLASGLNSLSEDVQNLRQLAEDQIATSVDDINDSLQKLENINNRVAGMDDFNPARSELLNERDRQLSRLSENMEIRVEPKENGTISISSKSGNSLLEGTAAHFDFDRRGNIVAGTKYSPDESKSGVGTVTLRSSNGYELDLINNGMLDSGRIGALINMRDNVLVETQAQLDEMAAGLSRAMSDNVVDGTPATSGASSGLQIDLGALEQGNTIELSFSENGTNRNITFVRVDDPSQLPLSNDQTATVGDEVIGIDFSAGFAAAAGAINAQLAPAINAIATATGLAFVDDGAANTTQISSLSSTQTTTGLQDGKTGLPLFMDGQGAQTVYSGSLDGGDKKVGLAGRLSVNKSLFENNELLVRFSADTAIGDASRPLDIADRLNKTQISFDPKAGIGSARAPFKGSIIDFFRQSIADQTGNAASAKQADLSQKIVVSALEQKLDSQTGVEVDEELAKLISLQNAYAANARIMQTVDEMMQMLLRI
ncbi:MAG: flagellar hook-associated protein FlgK [Hyphomicrobiaceae bacterium]|nr:flagellar hook-associated protein FlgK [Hyphomicrobiaceae bacterium]